MFEVISLQLLKINEKKKKEKNQLKEYIKLNIIIILIFFLQFFDREVHWFIKPHTNIIFIF